TLEDEENLILSNKNIGGQNTGVSAAELEKIATLYRTKLTEIRTKKSTLLPDIKKLNEKIQNIQNQLNELHAQKNKPTGEIIIHLYANENINNAQLEIEYVCNGVRWYPEYEIRVNELNKPLQFLMKAQITQNTGIDWENVSLTLSSSAPNLNHNKPELQPWYLYFQNIPQIKETYKSKMHRINDAAPLSDEKSLAAQEEAPSLKEAPTLPEYTLAYEKYTTQEYQIPIALNIPSGSKPARIDVYTFTADAKFSYYSAPKITEHAYLIADIRDWEKYNFMSGPLFIFIENTYIGQSEINPEITRDTFQVSLGIDQNISVKRQMIKKFNEKKIIGNARKEIRAYEISVKNKKSIPVEITIEDQIPLTSVQEIEVELLESSDAGYDKTTGKLSWKLILQPGEEKKLPFKYSVKYPKDKIINL
ncbi:MAG: mucoidy inhibitor MuiA family protein, partial [Bacteroidetes bacterium]